MRKPAPDRWVDQIRSKLRMDDMPAERYVALESHRWLLWGPLVYSYPDPEVDAHVRHVERLMGDYENLEALRREWLTADEYGRVQAEIEAAADDP